MTDNMFRPVLYVNQRCPFCLKLMIFLSEAGLLARFDVRKFTPGDANEQAVRDELAPHFEKVSFPVVQVAPGQYMKDSDALISHYAAEASIDPSGMVLLNYYTSGVFEQFITLFKENMALKEKLADRGGRV
ncbi:MAG TPA: glutathione S-transferase N-terminal domain-containing protein [Rhizorhapis sp.]